MNRDQALGMSHNECIARAIVATETGKSEKDETFISMPHRGLPLLVTQVRPQTWSLGHL